VLPIRRAYLKRVLAGAIFGLYMTHLLYFLNPQVDVTPWRLALVTLAYGLICGLLFGSILWGLRTLRVLLFGKPDTGERYRAHGFGFVVLAAMVAASLYWMHLEVFRVGYLPIGAVRVLAKATNLITITAFALLLLWFVERYAGPRLARLIFPAGVLVVAVSAVFLYARRDSYRTERENVVVANVGMVSRQQPVIVVAIRNLPYDWILTMMGEQALPFFDRAREHAYFTRLEPFPTMSAKALWASLATGKLPFRHGVTGRFAYRTPLNGRDPSERFLLVPAGVGFRVWGLIPPVQRIGSWLPAGDALPLWTIFERLSLRSAVIGWPWSAPGGASRVVTDDYLAVGPSAGSVRPPAFAEEVKSLSRAPFEAALQRFNGTGSAQSRIVQGLAADETTLAVLSAGVGTFQLNIAALGGFENAQRALHVFTNDLPPRSTTKGEAVRAYAEQLDAMLAGIASQYPDHLLVVVSPSGPVPPAIPETPLALLRETFFAEDPSADDGFVLITGRGIAHALRPEAAGATDVVPTVLYAAGLPVARDMDGHVLTDAFDDQLLRANPLSVVQTYEAKQLVVRRPAPAVR
jgi:Type I phosphodiesterase / nucleotide pyrophosphatase